MNILIFSDTHGQVDRAKEMADRLSAGIRFDLLIHCGDVVQDAEALGILTGIPVVSAPGNCDGAYGRDFRIVETPAGRLLVTHGHAEHIDRGTAGLLYLTEEQDCRAVCFGHTHVGVVTEEDGITLINPGSLNRPRGGSKPTCAVLVADERGFHAALVPYGASDTPDTPAPPAKKKKARGGYLRSLMNWSDGQ